MRDQKDWIRVILPLEDKKVFFPPIQSPRDYQSLDPKMSLILDSPLKEDPNMLKANQSLNIQASKPS